MKHKLAGLLIIAAIAAVFLIGCSEDEPSTTHEPYKAESTTEIQTSSYNLDTFDEAKKAKLCSGYWYQKGSSTVTAIKFNEGGSVEFTTYSSAALEGSISTDSGIFLGSYSGKGSTITIITERSNEPLIYQFDAENNTLIYSKDNISLTHFDTLSVENARSI